MFNDFMRFYDLHLKKPKITRIQTEDRRIKVSIKVANWNSNEGI